MLLAEALMSLAISPQGARAAEKRTSWTQQADPLRNVEAPRPGLLLTPRRKA